LINIEPEEVLRFQGWRAGRRQVKDEIKRLVQSQIDRSYKLIQPRAVFCIFPSCLCSEGRVKLERGGEFSIGKMTQDWTGLKHLALAICTIGQALEKEVSKLFSTGEYATAAMLDSAGSVAVESLADCVNRVICQQALSEGLVSTRRVSPGYGDWALQEQKMVFTLLPGDKIGVTLTGKYMMLPRKSVSFAMGIGEGFVIEKSIERCGDCDMVSCPYRLQTS